MIYPFRRIFVFSMLAVLGTVVLVAITGVGVGGAYAIAFGCLAIALVFMLRPDLPQRHGARPRHFAQHRTRR
jgi:hypothetical protein